MILNGLHDFVHLLESEDELKRIRVQVDPVLEMAEITDRISKQKGGGHALLFEKTGTSFPLLINSMGSLRRISLALGVNDLDEIGKDIKALFTNLTRTKSGWKEKLMILPQLGKISSWMPKIITGTGKCQEVVMESPDLSVLPILKCWPRDGGRFITLPLVHTLDPETGVRNVGMYRMQVLNRNTTGMHWHRHKVGARHYNAYKKLRLKMPVAVVLGGDPVYTYVATAPLPDQMDEYLLAGFLRKKKVELVKCLTQEMEVPADADIVIEGYVDPTENLFMEGPFGDHTGYYSLEDWYPAFHITCITHRKDAVYPATVVGIPPQEDAYIAKATERIFLAPIQLSLLPELIDMDLPASGVAHNLCLVSIRKSYPGQAAKVMNSLWGAGQMMLNKTLIVVDDSVNVHNYPDVINRVSNNFNPKTDLYFSKGPLDVLDHAASKMGFGGKVGIDATRKLPEEVVPVPGQKEILVKPVLKMKDYPEMVDINTSFIDSGIPLLICAIHKKPSLDLKEWARDFCTNDQLKTVKIICLVDKEVPLTDPFILTWIITNNMDPNRDAWLFYQDNEVVLLVIDGTRKIPLSRDFHRDWPNIIVSDEETIKRVDQIWPELDLGKKLSSPSLKFQNLVKKGGAKWEP